MVELARARGVDPTDLMFDLALAADLQARFRMSVVNFDEDEVAELLADHDAVIAGASELIRAAGQAAGTGVGYALCLSSYERFVEVYAAHSQSEQALLRSVDAVLDADARQALRALLEAI